MDKQELELTLINNEIERLSQKQITAHQPLSIDDLRRLEILLKTRSMVLTGPQSGEYEDTSDITDDDILETLIKKGE